MIELRWLHKKIEAPTGEWTDWINVVESHSVWDERLYEIDELMAKRREKAESRSRVLQYRTGIANILYEMDKPGESNTHWTDWQDVPEVQDE